MTIQKYIEAVEKADSADLLLEATEALAEQKDPAAIPTLIEILGYNNPGAAVAAVDGLIDIGEAAVPDLLDNLDDYNYGARAWTIRAFAGIGDPRALDLLLKAASTDFSLSVRRAAARGLGFINWSKLPLEDILPAQKRILETLLLVCEDGEWVVRYAAVVGLQALLEEKSEDSEFVKQILEKFQFISKKDPEIAVRGRALMALAKINYPNFV
ncbi:MAG: HEAT repeat domain-containing protein [Prochloraceae cyanobacterium]|nr:HEAT repeat domain-containing protein [Prochloraceae cyanobacterium]